MTYGQCSKNDDDPVKELVRVTHQLMVLGKRMYILRARAAHLRYMQELGAYDQAQPRLHMVNEFWDEGMHRMPQW